MIYQSKFLVGWVLVWTNSSKYRIRPFKRPGRLEKRENGGALIWNKIIGATIRNPHQNRQIIHENTWPKS